MLSDRNNQAEASVEPIESVGVEVVAPIPIPEYVAELVMRAKGAAGRLATLSSAIKNRALLAMAEALETQKDALLAANELDLEAFGTAPEKKAMADRLRLTDKRIAEMAAGLREVAALPDPLGEMPKMWTRPNGMQVGRVRVPIGVIGIVYESRPNVTADSAALCLKSGNACVLRGGSEAIHSNTAMPASVTSMSMPMPIPPWRSESVSMPRCSGRRPAMRWRLS